MNLTDDEIRKEYEKRIMLFTLKTGKSPKRCKLFSYLFAILDIKNFLPSNIELETGSKYEEYDRTAAFSKFSLRHLRNMHAYDVITELRKKDFTRYIGNYKLEFNDFSYAINIHYVHSNIRWDLIDYDLRKYHPNLVRQNENSFHILKNAKCIQKFQGISNRQLTLI